MGQRSQVYVRYETEGKRILFARYFQWNFGERMVSRARYTIEWLNGCASMEHTVKDKLHHIIETNFDMIDVCLSRDIVADYMDDGEGMAFNDFVFHDDNNDGKLLIDVRNDGIYYAFIDCSNNYIGDAKQYMNWNCGNWSEVTDYFNKETITYTKKNIRAIKKYAQLMTPKQVNEFLSYNYEAEDPTATGVSDGFIKIPA